MSRFFSFYLVILLVLGSLTGCSLSRQTVGGIGVNTKAADQYAEVKNSIFQLQIPKAWTAKDSDGDMMRFIEDDLVIGGVEILNYYADQPIAAIMPNHSEVLSQESLQGYFTEGYKVHLLLTQPAAALIRNQQDEMHYYFIVDGYAYDLYFNMDRVADDTMQKIAESFLVVHPKQPDTKIDTGRYSGLADNNFFEVKISGVPEEKAARMFMISSEVREEFEALNLRPDEIVKVEYMPNEYGQLVVYSIERLN